MSEKKIPHFSHKVKVFLVILYVFGGQKSF